MPWKRKVDTARKEESSESEIDENEESESERDEISPVNKTKSETLGRIMYAPRKSSYDTVYARHNSETIGVLRLSHIWR